MSYYSAEEMKKTLKDYPKFQKRLYCRGFLITNEKQNVNLEYPFYANWKEETIGYSFYMYTHKETYAYTYERNQVIYFIIGHAYDPYNMLVDENEILKKLASAREKSEADYWDAESNLTGVFCVGYVTENQIVYTTDCAGMQLVYHGLISDKLYITSHAKLVADLKGLKQPEYIKRLTTNKYWHYWGTWLPGDLSPFDELKRMVPNHFGSYEKKQNGIEVVRFYPTEKIVETKTQQEYENTIHELGIIIFVDDYMNIMTISACTKKLSDSRKVPREALAYVIDSTGAPVCVLLPFSTWAIFFAGIFWEQSEIVDLGYGSAMATYIHAIPYMFYALVALIIVPLFIFGVIPKLGAMKSAYKRVEETGQVYSKESQKWNKNGNEEVDKEAKIVDFLFPILTMIIVQLTVGDMFIAIIAAILAAGIIYIPRKKMRTNQFCDLWVQGFADSVSALVIIVAALWMRQASADINLPNYVMSVVEPFVNANIYPMVAFVVVAMLGFITGSNWGIPAVCAPIIIPLGAACGANLLIVIVAIVCGGTFCSHACFYSDATVITSSSCGIENMEHVYSQLPYTMIAAGIASILFLIAGFIF